MYRPFCLTLLLIASVPIARAEDRFLTPQEAVQFALEHNLDLRATEAHLEAARARLEGAGLRDNPRVLLAYADDHLYNDNSESNIELSFSQKLPLSDRLSLERIRSTLELERAELMLAQARRELSFTIRMRMLEMQRQQAQMDHLSVWIEHQREFLAWLKKLGKQGEFGPITVRSIRLEILEAEEELKILELEWEQSQQVLQGLLGMPAEEMLYVTALVNSETHELASFEKRRLEERSDLRHAELAGRLAESEVDLAAASKWGDVDLKVFFERRRSEDAPTGRSTDRMLGLSASLPLPLWNSGEAALRESLAKRRQAEAYQRAGRLRAKQEALSYEREVQRRREALTFYQTNLLDTAKRHFDEAHAAYKRGEIDLLTLHEAEEKHFEVYGHYLERKHELEKAKLLYRRALGEDFSKEEPAP